MKGIPKIAAIIIWSLLLFWSYSKFSGKVKAIQHFPYLQINAIFPFLWDKNLPNLANKDSNLQKNAYLQGGKGNITLVPKVL